MEVKNIGKSIDFFYIVNHNLVNSNGKYSTIDKQAGANHLQIMSGEAASNE